MTTLAQEVDARFMEMYATATIEDLERGLKTAMREANHIRYGMFSREEDKEWLHRADLLRAEIVRRKAAQNVEKEDALDLLQKLTNRLCGR